MDQIGLNAGKSKDGLLHHLQFVIYEALGQWQHRTKERRRVDNAARVREREENVSTVQGLRVYDDRFLFLFHNSTLCRPNMEFGLVANKWRTDIAETRIFMKTGPFSNAILRNLDAQTIGRLHLRTTQLEVRHPLEVPGKPVHDIFFLESGIASVTTLFKDGFEVEAGMYGNDSLSGISAFMGARESLNASYIQVAGHGFSCKVERAAEEFDRASKFRSLALRAVQAQFVQSMQSAGCNAHHDLEPRLARWLLLVADRTKTDRFTLSHEFISTMLGSRRSTVSIAAANLKRRGLIEYTRSKIHILDREALEARACECYGVLRDYLHNLTQYDSGLTVPPA